MQYHVIAIVHTAKSTKIHVGSKTQRGEEEIKQT
jgi:hypothetical protein